MVRMKVTDYKNITETPPVMAQINKTPLFYHHEKAKIFEQIAFKLPVCFRLNFDVEMICHRLKDVQPEGRSQHMPLDMCFKR